MSLYGVLEEQVGWYEASLSLQERRSRGHFSTPTILVEHILDACGYHSTTPAADLRSIRVLDPACGSGNFLAAAARRLISGAMAMIRDLSGSCDDTTMASMFSPFR